MSKVNFVTHRCIRIATLLCNSYIPVSYTHLDVYKRQDEVLSFTEDSDETLDFTENVDTLDADVEVSDDADVTEDTEA